MPQMDSEQSYLMIMYKMNKSFKHDQIDDPVELIDLFVIAAAPKDHSAYT